MYPNAIPASTSTAAAEWLTRVLLSSIFFMADSVVRGNLIVWKLSSLSGGGALQEQRQPVSCLVALTPSTPLACPLQDPVSLYGCLLLALSSPPPPLPPGSVPCPHSLPPTFLRHLNLLHIDSDLPLPIHTLSVPFRVTALGEHCCTSACSD